MIGWMILFGTPSVEEQDGPEDQRDPAEGDPPPCVRCLAADQGRETLGQVRVHQDREGGGAVVLFQQGGVVEVLVLGLFLASHVESGDVFGDADAHLVHHAAARFHEDQREPHLLGAAQVIERGEVLVLGHADRALPRGGVVVAHLARDDREHLLAVGPLGPDDQAGDHRHRHIAVRLGVEDEVVLGRVEALGDSPKATGQHVRSGKRIGFQDGIVRRQRLDRFLLDLVGAGPTDQKLALACQAVGEEDGRQRASRLAAERLKIGRLAIDRLWELDPIATELPGDLLGHLVVGRIEPIEDRVPVLRLGPLGRGLVGVVDQHLGTPGGRFSGRRVLCDGNDDRQYQKGRRPNQSAASGKIHLH